MTEAITKRVGGRLHSPGINPATSALRILLANSGVQNVRSGEPFSEEMVFGISGGIGAGVFAFRYEQDDISSLFIAGRHLWQDDHAYLEGACRRFGVVPQVLESGGTQAAAKNLVKLLEEGPVITWVDMASLAHRGMPASWQGGGYHVVVVYQVDEQRGTATVGDLGPEPIEVSLEEISQARSRIRKQRNRLMSIPSGSQGFDLGQAVQAGLQACHTGLLKQRQSNFTLQAFANLAERIHGKGGQESWDQVFPAGKHLWTALTSLYHYVEGYGSGGGLMRPLYARFLQEAGALLGESRLEGLSRRYVEIGAQWRALAESALPERLAPFREARGLYDRLVEASPGVDGKSDSGTTWERLEELGQQVAGDFPLNPTEVAELREALSAQVARLYRAEAEALEELGEYLEHG